MRIYAIRDTKADGYLPPFTAPNNSTALRTVEDQVRDPAHPMHLHSDDYVIYEIAEYNQVTGLITPIDPHTNLGHISSLFVS